MEITGADIQEFLDKHSTLLPPTPLDLIVNTIVDTMNTAIELYSAFPQEMIDCINVLLRNCRANIEKTNDKDSFFCSLNTLVRKSGTNLLLNNLYNNYFMIEQIAEGNLYSFEFRHIKFFPKPNQEKEAQEILLYFLDLTSKKLQQLNNEKSLSESEASAARFSDEPRTSEERKSSSDGSRSSPISQGLFSHSYNSNENSLTAKSDY